MEQLWNSVIVWPLMGILVGLNEIIGSFGLTIIALTLIIKLVTYPLNAMSIRSSKAMRDAQPLIEEVKRKYGKDKEKLTQETMRIYRENGINPMAGCLPMLVQMPIWFGLYWALINLSHTSEAFNRGFLWLPSLAQPDPFYILVVLTVATQFVVQKMMMMPSNDPQQQMMNKVMLVMPLTFGFVAMSVPSGLVLYWVTTNVFTFFQQLLTTGWGGLQPNAQAKAAVTVRANSSNPETATVEGAKVAERTKTRTPKAAKHKKRAGAKVPREEKKSNGKR
ncbi:MAG: YidC/Oxa1 family membrane protein insertase [Chloroflexota bacterium]